MARVPPSLFLFASPSPSFSLSRARGKTSLDIKASVLKVKKTNSSACVQTRRPVGHVYVDRSVRLDRLLSIYKHRQLKTKQLKRATVGCAWLWDTRYIGFILIYSRYLYFLYFYTSILQICIYNLITDMNLLVLKLLAQHNCFLIFSIISIRIVIKFTEIN